MVHSAPEGRSIPTEQTDIPDAPDWESTPPGQFAPWMRPEQRPEYKHAPLRHWIVLEGFCEHHGSTWHRIQIGEACICREDDEEHYQGYRRSDIQAIEKRGDMDRGTGIVKFWMPWGNFPPVPEE